MPRPYVAMISLAGVGLKFDVEVPIALLERIPRRRPPFVSLEVIVRELVPELRRRGARGADGPAQNLPLAGVKRNGGSLRGERRLRDEMHHAAGRIRTV